MSPGDHDFWGWVLFFDASMFFWLGGSMLASHCYLVATNLTTNEAINWKKYSHFKKPKKGGGEEYHNPYDRGVCANAMLCFVLVWHRTR